MGAVSVYNRAMQKLIGTAIGKSIHYTAKLRRGSGQALPGLVVERMFPDYYAKMLAQLPQGVVVITGTNGKTTTTKMVVELLRANGLRVLTNPTGSNLTRGINSMLIHQAKVNGELPFDIAVLELDEAYARIFAGKLPIRWVLGLNVTRDQLDRFGEVDTAATMIADTMSHATEGIVVNANDPRLLPAAQKTAQLHSLRVNMFSISDGLRDQFPSDDELVAVDKKHRDSDSDIIVDVSLEDFSGQDVTYRIGPETLTSSLQLSGQHNFQNAAAALALVRSIIPNTDPRLLMDQLSSVTPAFGRGEVYQLKNASTVRLVLVKNPAGFRQALASYLPTDAPIMVTINDNIADGRDVSWLWDVEFTQFRTSGIYATAGTRAADMALRLQYDDVTVKKVQPELSAALKDFCNQPGNKILFTTYTAMLWFHKTLTEKAGTEL